MLSIFTLALDSMPFITRHLPVLEKLKCDWTWIVCEGTAQNGESTKWCQPQKPRLSKDGTSEYLHSVASLDTRLIITSRIDWPSKDAMVRQAISDVTEPCVLMQIDSDELWLAGQLEKIVELFESDPSLGAIKFPCRYFVGENLVCVGENCWSNKADEYMRAWRFEPPSREHPLGMDLISHEPPKFGRQLGRTMERDEARSHNLVFDHFSYVTESQVAFKEKYYGYKGAVEGWRELQAYAAIKNFPEPFNQFPVPLRRYFSWVDDKVMVDKLNLPAVPCATVEPEERSPSSTGKVQGGTSPNKAARPNHRDSCGGGQNIFCHSGDLGDLISALPAIRALGGGALIITDGAHGQRESMRGARFDSIRPLLEAQPYITAARWEDEPQGVTHDFRGFRKLKAQMQGVSLAQWQWQYIGLEGKANLEPWLRRDQTSQGRYVVFARSTRYHNDSFPWKALLSRFSDRAFFVGLPDEHAAFQRSVGMIQFIPTMDLLDLAITIQNAALCVVNQSCPFWIAAGLGVPLVQETWTDQNSIVTRPNALYSRTEYETSKLMEKIERML